MMGVLDKLRQRFPGPQCGLILMYHRVADFAHDPAVDPWGLCVSPQHFVEQLQILKEYGRSHHLSHFSQAYRQKKTKPTSIVITFDDGYIDNLQNAKPLLVQADMPATVFIATEYIGGNREFWWDELARLILVPETLPASLTLAHGEDEKRWELETAVSYPHSARKADKGRRPWVALPGTRLAFFYDVWFWLRPFSHKDRAVLLSQIQAWVGDSGKMRAAHRPMTQPELHELAANGLIEIGAHTATHANLPDQTANEQHRQMANSKQQLEMWLNRPISNISYPHGEYDQTTTRLARKIGFESACTIQEKPITTRQHPFQLARLTVEDWDGDEFASRLTRWLYE